MVLEVGDLYIHADLQTTSAILPPNTCRSVEKMGSKAKIKCFLHKRGQVFN